MGVHRVCTRLLCLTFLILVKCVLPAVMWSNSNNNNNNRNSPEIALAGYVGADTTQITSPDNKFLNQNQFQNNFISKSSTDYVVQNEISQVIFSCKARYPITWSFPDIEKLPYQLFSGISTSEQRVSTFSSGSNQPTNEQFTSYICIHLDTVQFLSTRLKCKSLEIQPELQSEIYVYLDGKDSLEHEGETHNIFYNLKSQRRNSLTIPCRPSSPQTKVRLEQQTQNQGSNNGWKSLTNWQFDSKTGFTVSGNKNIDNWIYGLYRCSVITNNNDDIIYSSNTRYSENRRFVYFNVTNQQTYNNNNQHSTFQSKSFISGKAGIEFETSRSNKDLPVVNLKCCSGVSQQPPTLYAHYCHTQTQCELQKHGILRTFQDATSNTNRNPFNSNGCVQNRVSFPSVFVICQGQNIDFAEHYNNIFRSQRTSSSMSNRENQFGLGNRKAARNNNMQNPGVSITQYSPARNDVPVNQKMMLFVNRRVNQDYVLKSNNEIVGPPTIFLQQRRAVLDSNQINENPIEYANQYAVRMVEYDRDFYYEDEPLLFVCIGAKMFYAKGSHMRINWNNGSRTMLEIGDDNDIGISQDRLIKVLYLSGGESMFGGIGQNTQYLFAKTIIARQGMKSVDCWTPQVESSNWDKLTKELKVVSSRDPKFREPNDETVYLYIGDQNNVVSCTIIEGSPRPTMVVIKDGQPRMLSWNNKTRQGYDVNGNKQYLLRFSMDLSNVKRKQQSKLECIAKNVHGTVTRTVRIFVMERSRARALALPVASGVVGLSGLVVAGVGIKRWQSRRAM